MADTARAGVTEALNDLDFPASKEDIVRHAEGRGAPDEVMRLLRGLPLADYRNISEIRSSVPLDPAADERQSNAAKAMRAMHRATSVAEHLRPIDR